MNMFFHNIKVAWRNLMKYKLQTLISVLSIALGIVTLAFSQSVMTRFRLPVISEQPYFKRAYKVYFESTGDNESRDVEVSRRLLRSLKEKGALKSAETVTAPSGFVASIQADFHLADSTVRRGFISGRPIDEDYASYAGYRSAVTGKKIRSLKSGEAIISEKFADEKFPGRNPIGTVQWATSEAQPIPVTIVDVYESLSIFDEMTKKDAFFYCIGDDVEGFKGEDFFYARWINVVLKDGCSPQQLQREIDAVAAPLGLKAKLSKVAEDEEFSFIPVLHLLVFIIGGLILIAAIIGFLRIEIQLIAIRRRELTLRIVNGATRGNLSSQLFLEIIIPIASSVLLALFLGILLQDFINVSLNEVLSETGIEIRGLWRYSLLTGAVLTIICTFIIWVSLIRFRKTGAGLAVNMRRSRNHFFRNIMLGLQIAISMVFVCSTFIIINAGGQVLTASNVPDNDSQYREWLSLNPGYATQPEYLVDEIRRLKNLDRMVLWGGTYLRVREVGVSPEAMNRLSGRQYYQTFCTNDTSIISLMDIDVNWFSRNADRSECLLIGENLYETFKDLGLLEKGTLSIDISRDEDEVTLPIAGIIRSIPYDTEKNSLIVIRPVWKTGQSHYLLIPREGKGRSLFSEVNATVSNLEPEIMDSMVGYFRDEQNMMPGLFETIHTGGCILSLVSLLICAMSIFSSIVLDTRTRRKEVAIRKVNGAKSRDIYRMFGSVYIWLIMAAMMIAIPLCVLFNKVIATVVDDMSYDIAPSPIGPIALGCLVVIALIFAIVFCRIRRVMHVDPSRIIAKE